jgi:hypothetical protein
LFGATPEDQREDVRAFLGILGRALSWVSHFILLQFLTIFECIWYERRLRPAIEQGKQDYELPEHATEFLGLAKDELLGPASVTHPRAA